MDLSELGLRLLLLVFSVLLLSYFSNRNRAETMNPLLMLVALCTFSLCYLFTRVEVGVGIGFGLFAIFSILRFRTRPFNVNVIIFLFSTITLSILDIMFPIEDYKALLIFQSCVVVAYFLSTLKVIRYTNMFELKLPYDGPDSTNLDHLRERVGKSISMEKFEYKIDKVDSVSNEMTIRIFY